MPSTFLCIITDSSEQQGRLQAILEELLHELQDYEERVLARVKQDVNYACATCQRRTTLDGKALRKCGQCLTEHYCSV